MSVNDKDLQAQLAQAGVAQPKAEEISSEPSALSEVMLDEVSAGVAVTGVEETEAGHTNAHKSQHLNRVEM